MTRFAFTINAGNHFRDWSRCVNALARISDKILIEARSNQVRYSHYRQIIIIYHAETDFKPVL